MQEDGSLPGPGPAVLLQPVVPTKLGWNLGKVLAQQDLLDQFQFGFQLSGSCGSESQGT
jgi:hypothetical protein